jgi:hypothetical protein
MTPRLFCFAVDLVDDIDTALDDIGAAGVEHPAGVLLAASYHVARDFLPHNPRRRVHVSPAGVAFPPDVSRYPSTLPPHPHLPVCAGRDILADAVESGHARGMRVDAWTVYLHHDAADLTTSAGRVVNAFGDHDPVALCPAAPVVRDYAIALTADVSSRQPDGILAEALHYQPFAHGFHHERTFVALGGLARFLLSMCFCAACVGAARAARLDVDRLRGWVRSVIDGGRGYEELPAADELCRHADADMSAGTMAGYLALRCDHVRQITAACAETAHRAGVDFTFLDAAHALADPHTGDGADAAPGWQIGVDPPSIVPACEIATAFYVESAAALRTQLAQVTTVLGRAPAGAILRPMGGDLREGADLADAARTLNAAGVEWIGYYHYGLAPASAVTDIHHIHAGLKRTWSPSWGKGG